MKISDKCLGVIGVLVVVLAVVLFEKSRNNALRAANRQGAMRALAAATCDAILSQDATTSGGTSTDLAARLLQKLNQVQVDFAPDIDVDVFVNELKSRLRTKQSSNVE